MAQATLTPPKRPKSRHCSQPKVIRLARSAQQGKVQIFDDSKLKVQLTITIISFGDEEEEEQQQQHQS